MPTADELLAYLQNKLWKCVSQYAHKSDCIDTDYRNDVFGKGLRFLLNTVRDCNRLINSFNFKFSLCKNNVDVVDLITITAIEIFEPEVYVFIQDNMADMCNLFPGDHNSSFEKELTSKIASENKQAIVGLLSMVFCDMRIANEKKIIANKWFSDRRMHRMHYPQYFYRYILLRIDDGMVLKDTVDHFVKEADLTELLLLMNNCNNKALIKSLFVEVDALVKSMKEEELEVYRLSGTRLVLLLKAVLLIDDLSEEEVYVRNSLMGSLVNQLGTVSKETDFQQMINEIVEDKNVSLLSISRLVYFIGRIIEIQWEKDDHIGDAMLPYDSLKEESIMFFKDAFRRRILAEYNDVINNDLFVSEDENLAMKKLWRICVPEIDL